MLGTSCTPGGIVTSKQGGILKSLGPGILYAAAAVGASHLVQSTRAGANYGLALVLLILLTYVAKYPAFRFGAQYPNATGNSFFTGALHAKAETSAVFPMLGRAAITVSCWLRKPRIRPLNAGMPVGTNVG